LSGVVVEVTAVVVRAYRFALDPTPSQVRALSSHCGAVRVAFNWGLNRVKANLAQREAEKSYGLTGNELTPSVSWTLPALRRAWNAAKGEVAPWWAENSKEAYSTGLANLAQALKNWSDSKVGERKGRRVGFPRRKTKRRAVLSCRFTTGAIRVESDRKHVTLPRLGRLKTHESTRKLARRIEAGTARILSATVRRDGGRWFVSFCVEVHRTEKTPARPDAVIAVDLGVTHLAVLSSGKQVPNPRHLGSASRKLRRLARRVSRRVGPYDPVTRSQRKESGRWRRACGARARVERRVANLRRDGLHKLTTRLARKYGTVVVEDLNVAGMLRNRRLARAIADAGFGEIRRQLTYKTDWNGGQLQVADRWYPSSKTCSRCGAVKTKLTLSERTYHCTDCGLSLDRDLNAARNLAALAAQFDVAGSGPETENGRGADRKTPLAGQVAVKRLPGTAAAGQPGTVPPQGGTSNQMLTKHTERNGER
jgi:IS605 OrfB family transposase